MQYKTFNKNSVKNSLMQIKNKISGSFVKFVVYLILSLIILVANQANAQLAINKTVGQQTICNQFDVNLTISGIPSPEPVDVILVIDRSGSMASGSPSSMTYTKNAAINFVRKIFNPAYDLGNNNRIGLVSYSNSAALIRPLSYATDSSLIISAINSMVASGTTNIADGFYQASKEMKQNGRTTCNINRSIVLFTDGVANEGSSYVPATDKWGGASCATAPTSATNCTNSAYLRGQESQMFVVDSITYINQVFTVGLFGGISGATQVLAANNLMLAQNAGFFQTETGADLNGIYNEIFGQLPWAAKQVPGLSFINDTLLNGFTLVPGTLHASQGNVTINGQNISWDLPYVNSSAVTMSYSVNTQNSNSCGIQKVSNSWIEYQDPICNIVVNKFPDVNVCIPCTHTMDLNLASSGCGSTIQYHATLYSSDNGCNNGQQYYSWQFIMNDIVFGNAFGLSGSFTIPSEFANETCDGSIKGILSYNNGSGCSIVMGEYTLNNLVIDYSAPVISNLPESLNITVSCSSDVPAIDLNLISATDNCNGAVTLGYVNDVINSGSCANNFSISRTYRATDACGNYSDFVQTITIKDTIAPAFSIPSDITIYSTADCSFDSGINETGNVSNFTDNCSTDLQASYTDVVSDGPCQGSKIISRTWHLVDGCGNAAADQIQTITVRDTIAPVFTHPADITIYSSANCNFDADVNTTGNIENASDNCSTDLLATYTDVVSEGPCEGTKIISRTWHLVDGCGNAAADQIQTITVRDTIAPVFTHPADITIYSSSNCTFDADVNTTGNVENASDNCSTDLQATYTDIVSEGPCEGSKIISRTWHLVDGCGNVAADQVQTIIVRDTIAPVIVSGSNITVNNEPSLCGANVTIAQPSASDNCSTVTLVNSFNQTSNASGFYPVGISNIVWTATDNCGNSSTCSMTVTVNDNEAPVIICPADITSCSSTVNLGTPVVSDNCGIESITNNAPQTFPNNITIVTWTATDIHGNISTCTQTINISNITASASGTATLSCNNSNDGKITVIVSGGKTPYYFSINGGSPQSSNIFDSLTAGVYNITVNDASQCNTSTSMTIQDREPVRIDLANSSNANCAGKSDGAIDIAASGGTGPYQYTWSNGETTSSINNLDAAEYTVTVTDANGCTQKYSQAIIPENNQNPLVINNAFSPNGDGINDTWVIKNIEEYPGNQMVVLNRWGNEIYTTNDYTNNWDGSQLVEGTYFYILTVPMCGVVNTFSGYITIVR
jgi:gliding motility-associated-like protein